MSKNYLPTLKLQARLGASTDIPLRIETGSLSFVAISAMSRSAPLLVTAPGHGILDGWYVAIVDAKGLTELNAADSGAILDGEFHRTTRVDPNTLSFDGISSATFGAYTSGGYLAFYAPMGLSSYTSARMDVKKNVSGSALVTLNTTNGGLQIDSSTSTVWLHFDATRLSTLKPGDYVFDIEMVSPSAITAICSADSQLTVLPEVTTSV